MTKKRQVIRLTIEREMALRNSLQELSEQYSDNAFYEDVRSVMSELNWLRGEVFMQQERVETLRNALYGVSDDLVREALLSDEKRLQQFTEAREKAREL